jgi:hypothetical protein
MSQKSSMDQNNQCRKILFRVKIERKNSFFKLHKTNNTTVLQNFMSDKKYVTQSLKERFYG